MFLSRKRQKRFSRQPTAQRVDFNLMSDEFQAPPNKRRRTLRRALFLMFVFIGVCFIPAFVDMDMMNGGYALIVLSGFAAITCLITAIVYVPLARDWDRLFSGKDVLVDWRYDEQSWLEFTEADFQEELQTKKQIWWLVFVITIVVLIGFVAMLRDEASVYVALGMLGFMGVLRILAVTMPRLTRRTHLKSGRRILIGQHGVWQGGVHHAWGSLGSSLDQIEALIDEEQAKAWLVLTYSYPTRTGREETQIRLPVPNNDLREGRRVGELLAEANKGARIA